LERCGPGHREGVSIEMRLAMAEQRIAELEAENLRMRRERDELRGILHGIGRQADAASRRPAADLVAAAEAKALDR